MIDKLDQMLGFNSEALKLRAQRQEMLASNIANSDTPNYKAIDFKFSDALRQATGLPSTQLQNTTMARTQAGHQAGSHGGAGSVPVLYRMPTQASVDGNTVDMNVEQAKFADNAVRYEASLRFLNQQIKTMLSAIQS